MPFVVIDIVEVEGGEIEVFGACFGSLPVGWGDVVLCWPGEDKSVSGTGGRGVVLGGDVEGEGEEGLKMGEDMGGETGDMVVSNVGSSCRWLVV